MTIDLRLHQDENISNAATYAITLLRDFTLKCDDIRSMLNKIERCAERYATKSIKRREAFTTLISLAVIDAYDSMAHNSNKGVDQ